MAHCTLNFVVAQNLILEFVFKMIKKNTIFLLLQSRRITSLSRYQCRKSSNSIVRFLNFALEIRNRKFNLTGICDEGAGLVAVAG